MEKYDIKCFICGKSVKSDEGKRNISFYIHWIEYLPGQWMCRECKETIHDRNLIRYKLQFMDQDSLARK